MKLLCNLDIVNSNFQPAHSHILERTENLISLGKWQLKMMFKEYQMNLLTNAVICVKVNYLITEGPDTAGSTSPPGTGKSLKKKVLPQESESSSE